MPRTPTVEWINLGNIAPHIHVQLSRFTGDNEVTEWHLTACLTRDIADPAQALQDAWLAALDQTGLSPESTLMRRVFCNHAYNQQDTFENFAQAYPGAFSQIGQPPLEGGMLAIWSQHLTDPHGPLNSSGDRSSFSCKRAHLHHHWFSELTDTNTDSASQTDGILKTHDQLLADHGMTLAQHVVRTWWFVHDIDNNYEGLVDARKDYFKQHGLNENTRYIASTGIAGSHHHPSAKVSLDSYAIHGLTDEQIDYPSAPDHLGPTHDYGVTFERATTISYADRQHVFISGTASIDSDGNIVHPGNVLSQLERTMENIAALLADAKSDFNNLASILVYLRYPADANAVEKEMRAKFPGLPMVILHAPVCRPGWLIEIEGIAITSAQNPSLPEF